MMKTDISIILYYQDKDTADAVSTILRSSFANIVPVSIDEDLFTPFEKLEHEKVMFLYAIDDIERAKLTCLSLYKDERGEVVRQLLHCDYLLCKASDSKAAYELCVDNIFDDFTIIKPMYDKWSFLLQIRQTITKMELVGQLKTIDDSQRQVEDNVSALNKNLKNMSQRYENMSSDLEHSIQQSIDHVNSAIDTTSNEFSSLDMQDVVTVLDSEKLGTYMDEVKHSIVDQHLSPLKKSSDAIFQDLKNDIDVQQKRVATTQKSVIRHVGKQTNIMVADDHRVIQNVVRSVLERQGYHVNIANDGEDVMLKLSKQVPDLILMDINMPNQNGLETLRLIKSKPELSHIEVIMMTSYSDKAHVEEALMAGANDYIIKPTNGDILLDKVGRALHTG
ncbi:PleD family two-component system response regulator [Pseudomonadota bacterium]